MFSLSPLGLQVQTESRSAADPSAMCHLRTWERAEFPYATIGHSRRFAREEEPVFIREYRTCRTGAATMASLLPLPGAPSRDALLRSIAGVPWDHLAHAYTAATDAPVQLHRFLDARRQNDSLAAAVDWICSSIRHRGSIYSASPPVMWILADLLAADPNHPAAAAILGGLAILAEGCGCITNDDDGVAVAPVRRNPPGAPAWEVFARSPLPHDGV